MFKPILKNTDEITDFIIAFATTPIDEELVREYFRGCKGILKSISPLNLHTGNIEQNIRNKRNERNYESLPTATMPPLIVENGEVIDGNHRLRVAKKLKLEKINIYDIISFSE